MTIMKKSIVLAVISWFAASLFAADADVQSEVTNAAKKLGDAASYSWTATSKSDGGNQNFRAGPTDGPLTKPGRRRVVPNRPADH